MYRKKAKELLNKLKSLNALQKTKYIVGIEEQRIIQSIANECKSTVLTEGKQGIIFKRFESSIIKPAVYDIINELLANSSWISRRTMSNILYENGAFTGIDCDIGFRKGINSETGEVQAYTSKIIIDKEKLNTIEFSSDLQEIFKKFARDLIIKYSDSKEKYLPHINRFVLIREKLLHRPYTVEKFEQDYMRALEKYFKHTNKEFITRSAKYMVKNIMSEGFIKNLLESIKNGSAITILGEDNSNFKGLQNQIAEQIYEQIRDIPDLNQVIDDVFQIFKDTEALLTAYSIDFRGMKPREIDSEIKRINKISLKDEMAKYIGENGYRNGEVEIKNANINFPTKEQVEGYMQKFAQAVYLFVNSQEEFTDAEYIGRATMLMYRFIRIHPFPDSNGRTGRAILNTLTLNRNIFVSIAKEEKDEFIRLSNEIHNQIGENYLKAIYENPQQASKMEEEYIDGLANFIIEHSTIVVQEQQAMQRDENNTAELSDNRR